ncbi:MAG: GNAT family N-acetyltransferase [Lachnospiraceae bacterium]|nr:GNAT family N-acetyltransferase [uncultured Acetatifactor sp.]MCI8286738.1 GNAT family N-acetyltransferase [Lachnospiraceae bacterium]
MDIIKIGWRNYKQLGSLVADFRVTLKSYKGISSRPDDWEGTEEIEEYLTAGFPVFASVCDGSYTDYMVCRVNAPCVWVESLYTSPGWRRQGVASPLLAKAEEIAAGYGEDTLYHYVHPNNNGMIEFLRRHGCTVLNLAEIRKPYAGEKITRTVHIDDHIFD